MEWLLILHLLNPAVEMPTVTTQVFESRNACEQHVAEVSHALGIRNGSKTGTGSEVMLQCVAKVTRT